jgi:hypothetical protein
MTLSASHRKDTRVISGEWLAIKEDRVKFGILLSD